MANVASKLTNHRHIQIMSSVARIRGGKAFWDMKLLPNSEKLLALVADLNNFYFELR